MRRRIIKLGPWVRPAREHLQGPVHGTIQTIRGMCSDELPHEEIDAKLGELDDLVAEATEMLAPAQ